MGRLLSELADTGARRSKSATRIAAFVLENPARVVDMSIARLAQAVGVSEPTVNRFCTGLGLKGFPDFKLRLAAELARREYHIARDISADDSCADMMSKVFDAAHACLNDTLAGLDAGVVDEVVRALSGARSITLCGQGASSPVALDAQHKLMRFDIPIIAHADNLNQRMAAAALGADDCLVCISYTGRTLPVVEIATLGRESGATVIGITAASSPLAANCDLVLPVEAREDTDHYTPMTSRIGQLAVVDVITTRMAFFQGEDFPQHLGRIKQSLQDTRSSR
jgi:RpiR family carbohydrate utilization transcriptional regulator